MVDLLQNCDLPPPVRVYMSHEIDEKGNIATLQSSSSPEKNKLLGDEIGHPKSDLSATTKEAANLWTTIELGLDRGGGTDTHLLRALHLSQSRAREAERKATSLSKRCQKMSTLLIEEALQNYAHRQWIKLLEIEISMLKRQINKPCGTKQQRVINCDDDDDEPNTLWYMALSLVLGVAGVGLAVGYRYLIW